MSNFMKQSLIIPDSRIALILFNGIHGGVPRKDGAKEEAQSITAFYLFLFIQFPFQPF